MAISAPPSNNAGTQQIIYNPFTGNSGRHQDGVAVREQPDSRRTCINPMARLINDLLYPLPNTPGIGLGGLTQQLPA